jgi:hypothetical protein
MCDITQPEAHHEPSTEQYVADLKADWAAIARYSVIRTQFHPVRGKLRRLITRGLAYTEAKKTADAVDAEIRQSPEYRSGCMGNPLAILELDDPKNTYAKFQEVRAQRRARPHG